jgi:2-polyprenyl-3-methyl-5-hydroxy-6-metoxy-1,4-benzoquinol methylase
MTIVGIESNRCWFGQGFFRNLLVPIIFAPWADELVETARLRQGDRVLDVACGTGIVARIAARKLGGTGSVTGLDVSAPMITVARATALTEGVAVEWREASAVELPFPDAVSRACSSSRIDRPHSGRCTECSSRREGG